jgi:membrane protein
VRELVVAAGGRWSDSESYRLAASLSYYTLSSIFPLMLVAISVGDMVLGDSDEVRRALFSAVNGTNSPALRAVLEETLTSAQGVAPRNRIGVIIGIVGAIFAASGVFLELDAAFSKLFKLKTPQRTFWQTVVVTVKERASALLLVIGTSVILLAGTFVLSSLEVLTDKLPAFFGPLPTLIGNLAAVSLIALAMTLCYRVVPDTSVRWPAAAVGGAVASAGLYIVRFPLTWGVSHLSNYAAYGVVGALLLMLTWLYVASSVLLFGAAITAMINEGPVAVSGRSEPKRERGREFSTT